MSCIKLFILLCISAARVFSTKDLILVTTVFRHGDRTANPNMIYPNDPFFNETYYPYGPDQLTSKGKLREFTLGKILRQRYNSFLGNLYTPNILEARTTDFARTKMSLELVLAGLFPPNSDMRWHPLLNWQPIPYSYVPAKNDNILLGMFCRNYYKYYNQYVQSPKIQDMVERNREIFDYLTKYSGWNVTTFNDAFKIFWTLSSESEWGLELPQWTKKVFPETLTKFAIEEYKIRTGTLDLRKLAAGCFLQKLVEDTQAKIDGSLIPQDRKLFLYSAHDLTITSILNTLDIFKPHVPPYGSSITFEISKKNYQHGIEIFYLDYAFSKPVLMKLPECDAFCAWAEFVTIVEKYFPSKNICS